MVHAGGFSCCRPGFADTCVCAVCTTARYILPHTPVYPVSTTATSPWALVEHQTDPQIQIKAGICPCIQDTDTDRYMPNYQYPDTDKKKSVYLYLFRLQIPPQNQTDTTDTCKKMQFQGPKEGFEAPKWLFCCTEGPPCPTCP